MPQGVGGWRTRKRIRRQRMEQKGTHQNEDDNTLVSLGHNSIIGFSITFLTRLLWAAEPKYNTSI